MNCPICSQPSIVLKTLDNERRRECTACKHRFPTVEVLKQDHQRLQEIVEDARSLAEKLAA